MQASFNPVSSEQPRYRSGAVARMVRIPVATLRIWERRYQVVGPALTPSGHRLYSGADVERLLVIKQLVDQGHAIGSLAHLPMAGLLISGYALGVFVGARAARKGKDRGEGEAGGKGGWTGHDACSVGTEEGRGDGRRSVSAQRPRHTVN